MIVDDPGSHFIFVYHPKVYEGKKYTVRQGRELTNGEVLKFWGKWLVFGLRSRLDELARALDPYVEAEEIPVIKYDRVPSRNLGIGECVFMVYCDFRDRDEVWKILAEHGVKLKAWVTERETMELWQPGGALLERWLESQNLNKVTKFLIREDAGERLRYIYEHPDEIFSPWQQ
jgi:hypothetical protein